MLNTTSRGSGLGGKDLTVHESGGGRGCCICSGLLGKSLIKVFGSVLSCNLAGG